MDILECMMKLLIETLTEILNKDKNHNCYNTFLEKCLY